MKLAELDPLTDSFAKSTIRIFRMVERLHETPPAANASNIQLLSFKLTTKQCSCLMISPFFLVKTQKEEIHDDEFAEKIVERVANP